MLTYEQQLDADLNLALEEGGMHFDEKAPSTGRSGGSPGGWPN